MVAYLISYARILIIWYYEYSCTSVLIVGYCCFVQVVEYYCAFVVMVGDCFFQWCWLVLCLDGGGTAEDSDPGDLS